MLLFHTFDQPSSLPQQVLVERVQIYFFKNALIVTILEHKIKEYNFIDNREGFYSNYDEK